VIALNLVLLVSVLTLALNEHSQGVYDEEPARRSLYTKEALRSALSYRRTVCDSNTINE
jgi:hypothetical protein